MIHILWATIRPAQFKYSHDIWIKSQADSKNNITKTYVCVNNKADAQEIINYDKNIEVIISTSDRIGVCYPSYLLSSSLNGENDDIIIFASDDFLPPMGWDVYLTNKLRNKTACLFVRDGYQLPDSSNMADKVITIPILTYSALLKLNKIIYHPAYYHMCSDAELYLNAKELSILLDDRMQDTTQFTHHHWAAGLRTPDVNDHKYHSKFAEDQKMWNLRKNMTIEERLKI